MNDLKRAKEILEESQFTCVLVREKTVITSEKTGIAPFMGFLSEKEDVKEFSVADRIVGKAAAFLFVLAGIKEVYAEVLSEGGKAMLERYQIPFSYGELVENIRNRKNTGICPMEQAVNQIEEPEEAYLALQRKISEMRMNNMK